LGPVPKLLAVKSGLNAGGARVWRDRGQYAGEHRLGNSDPAPKNRQAVLPLCLIWPEQAPGILAQYFGHCIGGEVEAADSLDVFLDVYRGPVGAEYEFVGETPHVREELGQLLGRQAGDVDVDVAVQAHHGHRFLIPGTPPAMSHDDFEVGEIHRHIIEEDRIAVFDTGIGKDRRPRMEQYRNTQPLSGGVQVLHEIVVGIEIVVGWIKLESPETMVDHQVLQPYVHIGM